MHSLYYHWGEGGPGPLAPPFLLPWVMMVSDDLKVVVVMLLILSLQLMVVTAQKRAALGECEARHKEILDLEQNIRVMLMCTVSQREPVFHVCHIMT